MAELKKVFVVEGQTGEYSDHHEWSVAAYRTEPEAQAAVTQLEEWVRVNGVGYDSRELPDCHEREALKNPYDPHMQIDYTGIRYSYYSVDLRRFNLKEQS